MVNIQWVFFDIGSTIVDESNCYEARYKEITDGTNITVEQFKEKVIFYSRMNRKGDHDAAAGFGLEIPKWHKELEVLYPDVISVLSDLKTKGYKLGIVANQSLGTVDRLHKFGIEHYFDVIAASAEEGFEKPDARLFNLALTRANSKAENAVMIGDRLDNDIAPAKALKMKTVWIKQGLGQYFKPRTSNEMPDWTVNSLSELTEIF